MSTEERVARRRAKIRGAMDAAEGKRPDMSQWATRSEASAYLNGGMGMWGLRNP